MGTSSLVFLGDGNRIRIPLLQVMARPATKGKLVCAIVAQGLSGRRLDKGVPTG